MNRFLVEAYLPAGGTAQLRALIGRLRDATAAVRDGGTTIRDIRSTSVPEEETCFHVFEAASAEAVGWTLDRGGLPAIRILKAVALTARHAPALDGASDPRPGGDGHLRPPERHIRASETS